MFDPLLELQNGSAALWFQLVGVNQYNHPGLSALSYAAADCSGLVDVLRDATESFPHRHFFVYHDHASQSPPLNAPQGSVAGTPSCRRVVESLNQMTSQAKKEDTIMFYFSGHGFLEDATEKLYLCFPETDLARLSETALDIQVLLKRMKDSKAERQVLVLDACHSGGAISEGSFRGKGAIALARSEQPVEEPADIPELNIAPKLQEVLEQDSVRRSKQDVCYLLSSDVDQLSWELRDVQHGAFTYCLMNGIRSTGVADEQGRIEVSRLYEHVRNQTRQIVHERSGRLQTPYLLRRGSRDIVIGFQDPAKMENLSQLPLSRRKEHYELVFRQYLAHDYPT
ncbi:MAG TPA: caspase family protein, partial [Chroococcidiopsis sp.]